jgi:pSer/pThr/pTyr-binding forkhead associated (FHA) protein
MQIMNKFDRFEALAQYLVEGAFRRLFRAELHSTELAHHWLLRFAGRQLRLGEPVVTIGRAGDNDIVLLDPSISLYHAQLRWRAGRYHLCPPDSSRNGTPRLPTDLPTTDQADYRTAVKGQPKIFQPLASGDIVKLGNTTFTIVVDNGDL